MFFEEIIEKYLEYIQSEKRLSVETLKQKFHMIHSDICPYFLQMPIDTIGPDNIRYWQNEILKRGYTPTHIKKLQTQLSALFNYAKRENMRADNPCLPVFKSASFSSKGEEVQQRHQRIINLLSKQDISHKELEKALGINEYTRKNDIKILREKYGYEIESHKGILSLKTNTSLSVVKDHISTETIQLLLLLFLLNDTSKSFSEIASSSFFKIGTNITEYSLRKLLQTARESSLIDFCIQNNTYQNISNQLFFPLPENTDELFEFLLFCNLSNHAPKKLYDKAVSYLSNKCYNIIHTKTQSTIYNLSFYINRLYQLNYQNDALSFKYSSSEGKETTIKFFYVGLIIYSKDKDILYILGRQTSYKQSYLICRADRIQWDSLSSANNKSFQEKLANDTLFRSDLKQEFEEIKFQMFDISADKKEYIKIKLDYTTTIATEIHNLANKRKHTAKLSYQTLVGNIYYNITDIPTKEIIAFIIYEDTIRGLGSFANYIRKFGDHVTVLENNSLKKQLLHSASRVLDNYIERNEISNEH